MTDRAVPNLPSRDLALTSAFYGGFGFVEVYRDDGWLVLRRGELQLEFFRHDDLDPGVPQNGHGHPSVRPIAMQEWGQRMSTMLDPDGNLIRMIEDDDAG